MKKKYIIIIAVIAIVFIVILSSIVNEKKSKQKEQTIALLGDSLVVGYKNEEGGLKNYLSKYLSNTEIIDNSRSGSTITDNTGTDNIVIINQVKSLTGNPDIILFDGGINDIIGYGFGYLEDNLKKEIGSVDDTENTVIGDFEKTIVELKNKFPNSKLYYLPLILVDDEGIKINTEPGKDAEEIINRRESFKNEVVLLCEKYNINYVDVSEFNQFDITLKQDDRVHYKKEAYEILTKIIIEKLNTNDVR